MTDLMTSVKYRCGLSIGTKTVPVFIDPKFGGAAFTWVQPVVESLWYISKVRMALSTAHTSAKAADAARLFLLNTRQVIHSLYIHGGTAILLCNL